MSIDLSQYLDMFADEAREHLQALNQSLLGFEKEPTNLELVNTMFRSAHTLKGMSATMGFNEVAELTHKMENLLSPIRQGETAATGEIVDLLFRCLDALQEMVEAHIGGQDHEVEIGDLVVNLERLAKGGGAPAVKSGEAAKPAEQAPAARPAYPGEINPQIKSAISSARNNARSVFYIQVQIEKGCEMRNVRAFMVVKALREIGELIAMHPDEQVLTNQDFGNSFHLLLSTMDAPDLIEQAALTVLEIESISIEPYQEGGTAAPAVADSSLSSTFVFNEYDRELIKQAQAGGFRLDHVHVRLNDDCVLKSARAFMVNKKIEEFGEIIMIRPDVEDIEFERFDRDLNFLTLTQSSSGAIAEGLKQISELAVVEIFEGISPPERSGAPAPEATATQAQAQTQGAAANAATTALQVHDESQEKKASIERPAEKVRTTQTIRVDTERLDALLNLVGELVIGKTRLSALANEVKRADLTESIEHFGHIVFDLQSVVMQTRMVPIETVFNRFPRMIRDLAKQRGKQIELVMNGGETELDRTVIDEIGDPLVHLIRNALDHGIETPEEREAAGKEPTGTLTLAAFHEGSNVFIQIKDDGHGIDPERIKASSVRKGILTQEQADALTRDQAIDLIFAAGLSTAEVVTDISGRGVGMDAVRSKLELLNGDIKVTTELGVGSTFSIKLPLTLAIVQALLVKITSEFYAIPLAYIEETLSITAKQIQKANQQDVIMIRGEILPLIWMRNLLHCQDGAAANSWFVVVVRSGSERVGLCVDATVEMTEIVIKSLGKYLLNTRYISGGTILGDGTVALILDVAHIAG
jgi:two-component system, chemotaxis family, sensor kinase CheA